MPLIYKTEKNMQSKKLWQAWGTIIVFLTVTALLSFVVSRLFPSGKWLPPFWIGFAFLAVSVVFSLLRKKLPRIALISIVLNLCACGFFIGAYLVGTAAKGVFLWQEGVSAALVLGVSYFIFLLPVSFSRLAEKEWCVGVCFIVWLSAAGFGGYFVWKFLLCRFILDPETVVALHSRPVVFYLLLFIVAAGLAIGALRSADGYRELLFVMGAPFIYATGLVALIVLTVLGGDCDCDCSGCDCDRCSGSSGHGSGGKKNHGVTTMSRMSDPRP